MAINPDEDALERLADAYREHSSFDEEEPVLNDCARSTIKVLQNMQFTLADAISLISKYSGQSNDEANAVMLKDAVNVTLPILHKYEFVVSDAIKLIDTFSDNGDENVNTLSLKDVVCATLGFTGDYGFEINNAARLIVALYDNANEKESDYCVQEGLREIMLAMLPTKTPVSDVEALIASYQDNSSDAETVGSLRDAVVRTLYGLAQSPTRNAMYALRQIEKINSGTGSYTAAGLCDKLLKNLGVKDLVLPKPQDIARSSTTVVLKGSPQDSGSQYNQGGQTPGDYTLKGSG